MVCGFLCFVLFLSGFAARLVLASWVHWEVAPPRLCSARACMELLCVPSAVNRIPVRHHLGLEVRLCRRHRGLPFPRL